VIELRALGTGDAVSCDAVIRSLPYHFALESGREECARAVRSEPGLVALDGGEVVAFLTWVPRFDEAAEITWMAVRADRRRAGIGTLLIDRLLEELRARKRRVVGVLTVSPTDPGEEPPDGYQATRSFYRKRGFVLMRDLPGLWESDTAVLMVRAVDRAAL
jgi:ribosomal protein S18 acetylase RimI-like enzyme